jgi:hypothetical protein
MNMDRTIKLLLAVIAVMLTVIALRPYASLGANAMAETTSSTTSSGSTGSTWTNLGIIVQDPSVIKVPTGKTVREMQVLDNANTFVVRYDDQINVYHIQTIDVQKIATSAATAALLAK